MYSVFFDECYVLQIMWRGSSVIFFCCSTIQWAKHPHIILDLADVIFGLTSLSFSKLRPRTTWIITIDNSRPPATSEGTTVSHVSLVLLVLRGWPPFWFVVVKFICHLMPFSEFFFSFSEYETDNSSSFSFFSRDIQMCPLLPRGCQSLSIISRSE